MSDINQNWDRWVFASISQFFTDKGILSLHIEGMKFDKQNERTYYELRIDGPDAVQYTKNNWKLFVEINCLITTKFDDTNFHLHRKNTGIVSSFFERCIPTYKYGKESGDDDSLVGELIRKSEVNVSHFGQVGPRLLLQQSSVESKYEMELNV